MAEILAKQLSEKELDEIAKEWDDSVTIVQLLGHIRYQADLLAQRDPPTLKEHTSL